MLGKNVKVGMLRLVAEANAVGGNGLPGDEGCFVGQKVRHLRRERQEKGKACLSVSIMGRGRYCFKVRDSKP